MSIEIFINVEPPTVTSQQKGVNFRAKRFYKTDEVKRAEDLFRTGLHGQQPKTPCEGPVKLTVVWMYGIKGDHHNGEPKTSRPDLDNTQKILQDVMTEMGFWKDDSQVVALSSSKSWSTTPGIYIRVEQVERK